MAESLQKSLLDDMMEAAKEAAQEAEPEAKAEASKEDATEEVKESADAGEEKSEPAPAEAIDSLPEAVKAAIDSLPEEVRESFAARESRVAEAIAKAQERDAELESTKAALNEYDRVLEPYKDALTAGGVTGPKFLEAMASAKRELDADPSATLAAWAKSYGVDLPGSDAKDGEESDDDESVDPEIRKLRREIEELKGQGKRSREAEAAEARAKAQSELVAFKDAKDDDGKPKHPHFEDKAIQDEMARLMQANLATTLEDAYDRAVMMNPKLRQQVIDSQIAAAVKKADREREEAAKAAAKEAKRNGSALTEVTGSDDTHVKAPEPEPKSLRQQLEADMIAEARRQNA